MKVEKGPGYDWEVDYRFADEKRDTMLVFGQIKIEDAVKEARFSLDGIDGMGAGTYEILAARRV